MASALSLMNPARSAPGPARSSATDIELRVAALADTLAATAIARDRAGGHAATERQAIRDSGLLRLSIPAEYGGDGANWAQVLAVVRRLAAVDSALAHIFAFHHLQIASIRLFGNAS